MCNEDAERAVCLLSPAALDGFRDAVERTGFVPVVLCCFYHSTPLGQFQDRYQALVSTEHEGGALQARHAREYLRDPERYVRAVGGVDLRGREEFSKVDATAPEGELPHEAVVRALQAGQSEWAQNHPDAKAQQIPSAQLRPALPRLSFCS